MPKEVYHFRPGDFIPVGIGLLDYSKRNEQTCLEKKDKETAVLGRIAILLGYNVGLVALGAITGLELLIAR